MTLSEVLATRSSVGIRCLECDAHQSAYIPHMIEKHHPDTEFEVALRRHECMFCGEIGRFGYLPPTPWVRKV